MKRYNNKKRKFLACIITAILAGSLSGCKTSGQEKTPVSDTKGQNGLQLQYSVEKYKDQMVQDRVALTEYQSSYKEEAASIRKTEYPNVHFENCEFIDLPQVDELEMLVGKERGMSVQESWDTITNWLEEIGKPDAIDMKHDVRVVTMQFETDDTKEPPYMYPGFYEHMSELESGNGALVNCNQCHMQIAGNGIYSMSDGKITEYLGLKTKSIGDALGAHMEDVVEAGTLSQFNGRKYELTDGKLSVQKGAQLVKDYFLAGTPFACKEGISVDIPWVQVCRLKKDVYAYDYMVRRVYRGVPFVYMDHGSYRYDGNYTIGGDSKHAYVIDHAGVTAYHGYNEAEKLIPLVADRKIISVKQMAEILEKGLAPHVDIHVTSVGLAYLPVVFDSNYEERMIFPCWQLTGDSQTKGRHIGVFVDAFTGEIYYFT